MYIVSGLEIAAIGRNRNDLELTDSSTGELLARPGHANRLDTLEPYYYAIEDTGPRSADLRFPTAVEMLAQRFYSGIPILDENDLPLQPSKRRVAAQLRGSYNVLRTGVHHALCITAKHID